MFFTRTHSYTFRTSKQHLQSHLTGRHVKIHNLDFEILEKDGILQIIPHAEMVQAIKTLPVTNIDLREQGDKTKAVITFRMRKFDAGGPMLIIIFCTFMLIAAGVLFMVPGADRALPYTMAGISVFTLAMFSIRLQTGYFDYIRKIRAYVKSKGDQAAAEANLPLAV